MDVDYVDVGLYTVYYIYIYMWIMWGYISYIYIYILCMCVTYMCDIWGFYIANYPCSLKVKIIV